MKGDVVWRGLAWAVTPVHIGGGQQWTKQDYVIQDGQLCRIDPARIVAGMGEARRRQFEQAVDRGDLQAADRILKEAVRDADILERIPLGPASHEALKEAQTNPRRWGEVTPFIRTGDRPFIPGSSIKGAIRTALLSATVAEKGVPAARAAIQNAGRGAADALQRWAFAYGPGRTEQDPFRFVEVADVPLPEGATRIDRVRNWHPEKGESKKIQMHHERLLASCDDGPAPRFEVEVRIDIGRLNECRARDGNRAPPFELDAAALRRALDDFYWTRFDAEVKRFFVGEPTEQFLQALFRIKLGARMFGPKELRESDRFLLLRLGRFNQFESKSVDGIRRGWNPQARKAIAEGGTRNVIAVRPNRFPQLRRYGEIFLPLGWVLVWLRETIHG